MSSAIGRGSSHGCDVTLLSHVGSLTSLPARRRAHAPTSPDRARVAAAVADAVDAERARTRAWLHDTLLQQLEFIAAGGYADVADAAELMRVAAGAATELRTYVEDSGRDGELVAGQFATWSSENLREFFTAIRGERTTPRSSSSPRPACVGERSSGCVGATSTSTPRSSAWCRP